MAAAQTAPAASRTLAVSLSACRLAGLLIGCVCTVAADAAANVGAEGLLAEGSAAQQQMRSGQQPLEQGQHASSAPGGGLAAGVARLPTFTFSFAPPHADAAHAQRALRHERLPPPLVLPGSEVWTPPLMSLPQ